VAVSHIGRVNTLSADLLKLRMGGYIQPITAAADYWAKAKVRIAIVDVQ
jgi:hypothetical protein